MPFNLCELDVFLKSFLCELRVNRILIPHDLPQHHPYRHRYIERVLGAILWYLHHHIRCTDDGLIYTIYLIAKDQREFILTIIVEIIEHGGILSLLYRGYLITLLTQRSDCL